MAGIKVTIPESELRQLYGKMDQWSASRRRAMADAINATAKVDVESAAKGRVPVNLGGLKAAIETGPIATPENLESSVVAGNSRVKYAWSVEYGRRPGTWPNIGAIKEWVIQKNRGSGKVFGDADPDGLAFVIARAIKNRGIAPTRFMSASAEEARRKFRQRAIKALRTP